VGMSASQKLRMPGAMRPESGGRRRRVMVIAFGAALLVLLALAVTGAINRARGGSPPAVSVEFRSDGQRGTLFVIVHGFQGGVETVADVDAALQGHGDRLIVSYPAGTLSNSDPVAVAQGISDKVQTHVEARKYDRIVLVGHSIGALIVRKAYLASMKQGDREPAGTPPRWDTAVRRIVSLAGMNRGWDVTGKKPMDMSGLRRLSFMLGSWFGRLTGSGRLILSTEAGAPFVSNLRIEWMQRFRNGKGTPEVVQLLGDIDDVVSDEDNKDLSAAASGDFVWVRVRGTGHGEILRFSDGGAGADYQGLGAYRREKFLLAATAPIDVVRLQNEEQIAQTDNVVEQIVFVLHGIRDLGRWSARFEKELLDRARTQGASGRTGRNLVVVSIRYGYFSMASFLFRPDRQKYVRWFMDEYTETLARYPRAQRIDFVGHSNGTYLLASALEQYSALKVNRVVFAGSVVRRDFDWASIFERKQVQDVQNYVARDDWVVALFPRFFEQRPLRFLGNDVGSAGFNGFDAAASHANLSDVGFVSGQHSAFLDHAPAIAEFLTAPAGQLGKTTLPPGRGGWQWFKVVSDYGCWAVWLLLAVPIVWAGVKVAVAAGQLAWVALILYSMLVIAILATA
jgi:pimeloyl-ACP methyl ester carboxylesterase